MADLIWKWLEAQSNIIIAIVLTIAVCWFVIGWIHRVNTHIRRNKDDYGKLNTTMDKKVLPKLNKMTISMNNLVVYLSGKDGTMQTDLFKVNSPVQLSDFGEELLSDCGGRKFIDEHASQFIPKMEDGKFKSALDVQNFATILIMDCTENAEFTHIKNFVYQNPVYKKGQLETVLNMETIYSIMGIYLRNKYFEIHPELKDVDASIATS